MTLPSKIIELIVHARKTVGDLAEKYHGGGAWGNGLTGYCGIASRFLISLARRNGIYNMRLIAGSFDGKTHCWVEYGDFCIDLTISQFNGFENTPYRICYRSYEFYKYYYKPEVIGSAAVQYQKKWDLGQSYESCSSLLWRIHKANYIREYNGKLF